MDGSAKEAVVGFPVTNEAYEKASNLLKNCYGNPQLIMSFHMNNLIKLEKVENSNVKELRKLFDRVEGNVRALNTIGINSDHFGPLLIPIVLEKLPNVIRLQISCKLGKNNWNIEEFLVAINAEITARENYEFLKHDENNDGNKFNSQHALASGINKKKCCFCKSEAHYSDRCDAVVDVQARRDILKKEYYRFNCLKQGRSKKDYRTKLKCYKCKSLGSHHTALCEFQSTNGTANFVSRDTTISLQTADAKIVNNKNYHYVIKVLFDSCSQQTYISEKVVRNLNLMALQEINFVVKAFGSEKEKVMKLKEYEICLQSLYDNRDTVTICALALPNICLPVGGQYIDVAVEQNPCLQSLNLADRGDFSNKEINLLIGADF